MALWLIDNWAIVRAVHFSDMFSYPGLDRTALWGPLCMKQSDHAGVSCLVPDRKHIRRLCAVDSWRHLNYYSAGVKDWKQSIWIRSYSWWGDWNIEQEKNENFIYIFQNIWIKCWHPLFLREKRAAETGGTCGKTRWIRIRVLSI